jgi:hypothetical protein
MPNLQSFQVYLFEIFPGNRFWIIRMGKVCYGQISQSFDMFRIYSDLPELMWNTNPGV